MSSPQIKKWSWGKIEIEGIGKFKDAKLYPGGARAWDWNETGTQHSPGIQVSDIEELIQNGSEIIVLSQGFLGRLKVSESAKEYLNSKQIEYYTLKSEEAIQKYNQLSLSKEIGGLFHSTC